MANEMTVQKTESLSNSEAFTNKVLKEFGSNVAGNIQVTDYQRQLIQGYFIATDRALKMAEEKRVSKNENNKDHKWDNPDPINWNTVDLNALALDVVHYARMGLDMMQDNHLSAIPFKDNNRLSRTGTKMYVVNLMPGYNGIQYIAEKYALEKPVSVTVELVYSTDTFKPLKKNRENRIESYDFEINNAFDRGQIVGGFGYIEYEEPTKNKLIIMTLKDILKRKPEKASGEFWGGKKTAWEKGQKVEVETEGWFEEMCLKTVKREVYSAKNMPRDPKKIHYVGATGTAKNNIDYYNQRSTTQASADFYVGFEGEIWQYNPNPKARYCWAVGGGRQSSQGGSLYGVARNANSVSIEMCVRNKGNKNANSKDWYFEQATINSAIELTKYLMKLYGVPASRVIRHFDVNGKYCPGVYGWNSASGSESAWNDFKKKIGSGAVATPATPAQPTTAKKYYRVRKTWADAASQKGAFTSLANAKACADQNRGYKVFDWNGSQVYPAAAFQPYHVRVEIADLRIRKGAGTNYDYWTEKNGQSKYTGKGTFTIVKEKNGAGATKWGLLKAYEKNADGWISLDYVKRV